MTKSPVLDPNYKNPKRLAAEWEYFVKIIFPNGASEIQIKEMRRAFYCGAEAAVMRILVGSFDDKQDVTDNDMQIMHDLAEEIEDFGKEIAANKA